MGGTAVIIQDALHVLSLDQKELTLVQVIGTSYQKWLIKSEMNGEVITGQEMEGHSFWMIINRLDVDEQEVRIIMIEQDVESRQLTGIKEI